MWFLLSFFLFIFYCKYIIITMYRVYRFSLSVNLLPTREVAILYPIPPLPAQQYILCPPKVSWRPKKKVLPFVGHSKSSIFSASKYYTYSCNPISVSFLWSPSCLCGEQQALQRHLEEVHLKESEKKLKPKKVG